LFKGKKIKKLIEQYAFDETGKADPYCMAEFERFGRQAVPYVIEAFQRRKIIRPEAQYLLEKLSNHSQLFDFIQLLGNSYNEIRHVAKEIIEKRWRKASVPELTKCLESPNAWMLKSAVDLLNRFRDPSCVSTLISMYNEADPNLKTDIITILSNTGGQAAKKLILSALNDESWRVRLSAVKNLGKMRDPECVEPLIERLSENEYQIRMLVLDALGEIGDKRAVRPMLALLKDDDLLIRQKATEYIIQIGDSEIVPDVIAMMRDEDVNVRRCSVEILNNLKDPRTSMELFNALKDSDWWVRQIATDALADLTGENIVKGFIDMLEASDENIRRCAVEFFNKVSEKSALKPLVNTLRDTDWWVREKAVSALGKLRDERAIGPLARMIHDEEINFTVPLALAQIGGSKVIQPLTSFLRLENKPVRIAAIRAFGNLKVTEAVPFLKAYTGDPDVEISNEALQALKQITGKVMRIAPGKVSGNQAPQNNLRP